MKQHIEDLEKIRDHWKSVLPLIEREPNSDWIRDRIRRLDFEIAYHKLQYAVERIEGRKKTRSPIKRAIFWILKAIARLELKVFERLL